MVGESPPSPLVYMKPKKFPIAYTRPATATKDVIPNRTTVLESHPLVLVSMIVGIKTVVTRMTVIVRPMMPPTSDAIIIFMVVLYINV